MLQNLRAEMERYGITTYDLSCATNRTERSIRLKVSGKNAFTLPEGFAIRNAFFPGMSLEYLFAKTDDIRSSSARKSPASTAGHQ